MYWLSTELRAFMETGTKPGAALRNYNQCSLFGCGQPSSLLRLSGSSRGRARAPNTVAGVSGPRRAAMVSSGGGGGGRVTATRHATGGGGGGSERRSGLWGWYLDMLDQYPVRCRVGVIQLWTRWEQPGRPKFSGLERAFIYMSGSGSRLCRGSE
jgi:hypothetical protein